MHTKRFWQQATLALTSGLEVRHLQRHRTLAAVPVEGVVVLNLGCLLLLLIGQSI
ncbi:MAG: hypothetical protein P8R54_01305 [Myxococcota bacterium]|nr:hypothetical protein [Myxococcota bacterium]